MKNIIEHQVQFIEWSQCKEGFFFWDIDEIYPIGYWPTKEQASLMREIYGAWVLSDKYPEGNWREYNE
jgi:hypothetical protein